MQTRQVLSVICKTKQNPLIFRYVHINYMSCEISGVRIVVHTGLEPVASRVWSERDNHYTIEPMEAAALSPSKFLCGVVYEW